MSAWSDRLEATRRSANMTVADLARWLDRPHATVTYWLRGGEPAGGQGDRDHAEALIGLLEALVRRGVELPVPLTMPQRKRIAYLRDLRARILPHLPHVEEKRA
jgi:hypothetical protein